MHTPFCTVSPEVIVKVRPGPAEAAGKVSVDFGLVQIPRLGFDCGPAAA